MALVPTTAPNGECLNVHPGMFIHVESLRRLGYTGLPHSGEKKVNPTTGTNRDETHSQAVDCDK